MRWNVRRLASAVLPGGSRRRTIIIAVLAAIFMLSGLGSQIMDSHDTFAKTDRLAAISLILSGVPDGALPVTLLDVDDATRTAWKSRGATPHAALAELVRIAASGGAKAILLDFDLNMDMPGTPADPAMSNLLRSYPADAPLLMLVRKIGFARSESGTGAGLLAASTSGSPYDVVAAGKPNIMWVTTLNEIGSDRSVKRVRLWQTVCEGASGLSYPSAALVTAGMLIDGRSHSDEFRTFLESRVSVECGGTPDTRAGWPPVREQATYLPYVFGNDAGSPALLKVGSGGRETVVLRRISASRLVDYADGRAAAAGEIDRDPFAGRVALIGASYTESSDVHETPLGTMPGSIIIANSIVQAQTLTSTVTPSHVLRNLLALAAFGVFAYLSRYLVGVLALISIGLMSIVVLIAVSRGLGYESGLEVVGVSLTGFALFKLIDALGQIIADIPKRGWRAILKP